MGHWENLRSPIAVSARISPLQADIRQAVVPVQVHGALRLLGLVLLLLAIDWTLCAGLRAAERSSHPLVKVLADMDRTLERLLSLQQLLPDVDVSTLVSKRLDLLLEVMTLIHLILQ